MIVQVSLLDEGKRNNLMENRKYYHSASIGVSDNYFSYNPKIKVCGFTLIEVILVVVILAVAAAIAIPYAISGASIQINSAANVIASDIEYAKSMAISRGRNYWVDFDESTESYQIKDANGVVIDHPIKKGFPYTINFSNDGRLNKVNISSVDFDGGADDKVGFNYLGSPLNETNNPMNSGVINLSASDGFTMTINVEPVTGYVSISQ